MNSSNKVDWEVCVRLTAHNTNPAGEATEMSNCCGF